MQGYGLFARCATASLGMVLIAAALGSRGRWKSAEAPGVRHVHTQVGPDDLPSEVAARSEAVSPLPTGWTQGWLG